MKLRVITDNDTYIDEYYIGEPAASYYVEVEDAKILFDVDDRLKATIAYLEEQSIDKFYPCHCVSFRAKAEMNKTLPVEEVGVGLTIDC